MRFNKPQVETQRNGIPKCSDICGIPGCKSKTSFSMLKVSSPRGIEHRVASEVSKTLQTKQEAITVLNDDYNFISWFVRCDDCLAIGIRNKRAKLKLAGEHPYYC